MCGRRTHHKELTTRGGTSTGALSLDFSQMATLYSTTLIRTVKLGFWLSIVEGVSLAKQPTTTPD